MFSDADHHFMQQALALAKQAEQLGEVPVGAIVVRDNEVIGEGFNQPIAQVDPSAHAEIMALRTAAKTINNYRLLDTTLYVTIEPCAMCAGAIIHARVKRVVFGAHDRKTGAVDSVFPILGTTQLNHVVECQSGLLADPCANLLSEFFKKRR